MSRVRFLAIVGAIALVFVGLYFFLRARKTATPIQNQTVDTTVNPKPAEPKSVTATEIPAGATVKVVTTLEAEQNGVKQLAKVFVERYNSYSSDNNYQNIREIEELVTPALWTKISARLSTPPQPSATFMSVITETINATMADWKTDRATITVKTRKITENEGKQTEQYQTISVVMVKQNSIWLAESFTTI
ncbi:MAG: hypothetical protein A3I29_00225 [Candidatus Magasanikbacteria bacterium RIFCSPLOWO2_02_FULL_44_11]|uniref:Uncharacterized protein n=2 Tax=Candidatus Magasanikiibacteriota TaxID=1752731 RepID=A0A1F6NB54_9BACT|nr:MAG: hypothetical protein A3D53_01905 [Candidatus Magasanikbacteria bacterium RIFCSPHIGHO2_02_FULL_45_10]OGH80990.1 MAG: hypothetical protein A3I29_00225 [Candidatus Magasanikbacteria bacterium RIFCSPLOWO2_02_FULL_44_11]